MPQKKKPALYPLLRRAPVQQPLPPQKVAYCDYHKCERMQVDEIWAFVYAKEKNVTPKIAAKQRAGDAWSWTAIDADTKLVPCWLVADRSPEAARDFIEDLERAGWQIGFSLRAMA